MENLCDYGICTSVNPTSIPDSAWILDLEDIEKDTAKLLKRIRKADRKTTSSRHFFSKGNVLYSKLRTYLNKVIIADMDGFSTTEILPLDFKGFVVSEYAQHVLMSKMFLDYTAQCGYGVKMPRLGTTDGKKALFPLPPYSEQECIVKKIQILLSVIDSLEENKEDLNQFIIQTKSKILDLAIRGKIVPQDPKDEPASVLLERMKVERPESKKKVKNTGDNSHYENLPFEIPENWTWCRLGEFNNIARGGSPRPIKDFLTESEDGVNWIKIGDTEKGGKYIYATREKITKEGIKHSRFVNVDDFLLTNSMSFGRPYILKTDGCIHDGWLVINVQKKLLDVDFMYYLLSSDFMYTQFYNSAVGSTVKNLKTETVQQIPFPLPPINEQKRIIKKMEDFFVLLDAITEGL
ncbi:restriction endonuclease subunit S [Chryseobacterium sp.]|uniref:restriction endonuclease subunit S n=1 Tax=Chryseobacterium sp. TaxID=1871047 RepID=UPI0028990AA8|nr:restriction endonuclease subunit S [Chryseobacterium sp.]